LKILANFAELILLLTAYKLPLLQAGVAKVSF